MYLIYPFLPRKSAAKISFHPRPVRGLLGGVTAAAALVRLTRLQALGLVVVIWAGIYLPALGSLEIKGEEGRRILPGVAMLDTGQWVVPTVGGVPFLNKPPLVNWLAAASFRLTGTRNEWAARAPSVLVVLALGLTAVWALADLLTPAGGLLAAIFALTNIGLMEKGRLAEIEALYLGLYGIALLLWLGAWHAGATHARRTPIRTWVLPWVVLGLGLLAKGPLHLLFFYAVVVAVLTCAGRLRDLWNWAHLVGVLLMLGVFVSWALPYLHRIDAGRVGGVWYAQVAGRLEVGETFRLVPWLLNVPRGLVNFLPWVVLLPLAWRWRPPRPTGLRPDDLAAAIVRGLRWAVGGCFLVVSFAPGGQPRYALPLLTPASVLLALILVCEGRRVLSGSLPLIWSRVVMVCLALAVVAAPVAAVVGGNHAWRWSWAVLVIAAGTSLVGAVQSWKIREGFVALGLASALAMMLLTLDFAFGAVPWLRRAETVRPAGRQINAAAHGNGPIAVLQPGFVPFLFYLGSRPLYLSAPADLPFSTVYLLVRKIDLPAVEPVIRTRGLEYRVASQVTDKRLKQEPGAQWLLLRLNRTSENSL